MFSSRSINLALGTALVLATTTLPAAGQTAQCGDNGASVASRTICIDLSKGSATLPVEVRPRTAVTLRVYNKSPFTVCSLGDLKRTEIEEASVLAALADVLKTFLPTLVLTAASGGPDIRSAATDARSKAATPGLTDA